MRTIILLGFVTFLGCASPNPSPKLPPPEHECTAYGHGPYNMDRSQCLDLAKNQARTNCGLNGKRETVVYFGREWNGKRMLDFKGSCVAGPSKTSQECEVKSCQ